MEICVCHGGGGGGGIVFETYGNYEEVACTPETVICHGAFATFIPSNIGAITTTIITRTDFASYVVVIVCGTLNGSPNGFTRVIDDQMHRILAEIVDRRWIHYVGAACFFLIPLWNFGGHCRE